MTQPFKVGVIGAGGRSVAYASHYANRDDVAIVAVADPSTGNRALMASMSKIKNPFKEYDNWRDLYDAHPDLDGVVISTPNFLHADPAIAALERRLPVALEKPLATTIEDCQRIILAEKEFGGRTLVGFVLRSTPFYSKIHELVRSGAIGRIASIQADELVGRAVTSVMFRGNWRRYERLSGGVLLEKCCHDMDLINWLMGCRPVSVSSFGGTLMMGPNPSLPDHCDGCKVADDCQYYKAPAASNNEDRGEEVLQKFVRETDVCIFNNDKDIIDTQSVQIAYENGSVANFMLTFNAMGKNAGRNIHIVGSKGRIWGNLHDACVYHHDNASDQTHAIDTRGDGSGHGGGDRLHALQLQRMMADNTYRPESGAAAGYLSAALSFAADRSRHTGKRVSLRYQANGFVEALPV